MIICWKRLRILLIWVIFWVLLYFFKDLEVDFVLLNIKKVVVFVEDEVCRGEYEEICNRNIGDSES